MSYLVDDKGFYGAFGGAYVPEILYATVENLRKGSDNHDHKHNHDRPLFRKLQNPQSFFHGRLPLFP